jgi:hypothetical protein
MFGDEMTDEIYNRADMNYYNVKYAHYVRGLSVKTKVHGQAKISIKVAS